MPRPPETLKKRAEFLVMNQAAKWVTPGFILQYQPKPDASRRVGYTVSKKVGNAVTRNRVKRRLRAIAAEALANEHADMVLIGRPGADALAYRSLIKDLRWALKRVKGKLGQERAPQ